MSYLARHWKDLALIPVYLAFVVGVYQLIDEVPFYSKPVPLTPENSAQIAIDLATPSR